MIAATDGVDIARLLLDLLIVIVAARVCGELAERARIPAVLGEIAAGVLIGPSVLGAVQLSGERGVSIAFIAEMGVLLLLLQVGMEMDLAELGRVGGASLSVALIGVVLPFVGGTVTGVAMGEGPKTAVFLGAALTATSVGITARVFGDLRALATTEARVVVGAAVADDVLGLVILTVVVKVVTGGSIGVGTVAGTLGLALLFLVATGVVTLFAVPKVLAAIQRRASSGATVVVAAVALTLAFAELADAAKLAFIIGAFMAGLGLGRSEQHERIATDLGALGNLFIPVFFAQIGINADLEAMIKPNVLALAAVLTVVGILGKLAAGWGAFGTRADKLLIGVGMIPRGEVGLIFASIGLANGVLDRDLYGAVLVVVLVTTVMTPPLLRIRLGRSWPDDELLDGVSAVEPEGGWVQVVGDEVRLVARPPAAATATIALTTARLLAEANPSADLLDWFGDHRNTALTWNPADTPILIELLRSHEPRSWRFLEVTGVLERALPEVATAVHRRRADLHDLDPVGSLRFPVVESLHAHTSNGRRLSDELIVAAFAADVCRASDDDAQCAADLAARLGWSTEPYTVGDLVADAHLLRDGARRPDAFDGTEVLQLATHLSEPTRAVRSFALARALGDLPLWQRDALGERERLVLEALAHPELTGTDATNVAGARRQAAQRLAATPAAAERLAHAPLQFLLAHDPVELAREARLVEPLVRPGVVRIAVSPDPEPDMWIIDVACHDQPRLLARLTGALADNGLDVHRADVATWPDGAVLDTFVVAASERPRARDLAGAMQAALRAPLRPMPTTELAAGFDNGRLPWHTACSVTGPDRRGALQAISAAFAEAGVHVHTAVITSATGRIDDRFTLTDRVGRKLDDQAMDRVRQALDGERTRRRVFARR